MIWVELRNAASKIAGTDRTTILPVA